MSTMLWADENRVDRESQLMLMELQDEGWVYGRRLRRAAEFEENAQVFYRMEQYLLPAGLVEEAPRSDRDRARQFRLTDVGAAWLDTHSEEISTPATREEIRDLAREGYEAGTSARESVQNYRKQLHRLKNRHDALEDETEEIADQQGNDATTLDWLWERSETNKERSTDTKKTVEELAEAIDEVTAAVEERATIGTVEQTDKEITVLERRLRAVERKQTGLLHQQARTERDRAQLSRLATPAGYLVGGAVGAYLVVLVGVALSAPELVTGVIIAGIGAALGVAVGVGVAIYAYGGNITELSQSIGELSSLEAAE